MIGDCKNLFASFEKEIVKLSIDLQPQIKILLFATSAFWILTLKLQVENLYPLWDLMGSRKEKNSSAYFEN